MVKLLGKEYDIYALNGLLAAEGGAQIGKKGLHRITLSFNSKEKSMFQYILDRLELKYTIGQDKDFIIQGWSTNIYFLRHSI